VEAGDVSESKNGCDGSTLAVRQRPRKRLESLRVFGRSQAQARRDARRQASEKPRWRKPRGEFAPAVVSVYGDLVPVHALISRFRTGMTGEAALRSVSPKSCGPTELIRLVAGATGKPLPYTSVTHALNQLERRQAARKVSSNRWQYIPEKEPLPPLRA
jgi:hypothetical protein